MYCASCGSTISKNARFCSECGERVTARARAADVQPQPAPVPAPARAAPPPAPSITREEATAVLSARAELGDRLEPQVVDAFIDRIEDAIDERVDAQINSRLGMFRRRQHSAASSITLPVAICSLIFGIPLSAIAGAQSGLAGLVVCWAGIAIVNAAVNNSASHEERESKQAQRASSSRRYL